MATTFSHSFQAQPSSPHTHLQPRQNHHHHSQHLSKSPPNLTLRIPHRALAPRSPANRMHHFIIRNLGAKDYPPAFTCPSHRLLRLRRSARRDHAYACSGATAPIVKEKNVKEQERNEFGKGRVRMVKENNYKYRSEDNKRGEQRKRDKRVDFAVPPTTFQTPRQEALVTETTDNFGFDSKLDYEVAGHDLTWNATPPRRESDSSMSNTSSRKGSNASFTAHGIPWGTPPRREGGSSMRDIHARKSSDSSLSGPGIPWNAPLPPRRDSQSTRKGSDSSIFSSSRKDSMQSNSTEPEVDGLKPLARMQMEMPIRGHTFCDYETVVAEGSGMLSMKPLVADMSMEEFVQELLLEYPNIGA